MTNCANQQQGAVYTAPAASETTPAITLRELLTSLQEQKPLTIVRFDDALGLGVNPAGVFVPNHEKRTCDLRTTTTLLCVQDVVSGCDAALRVYGRHIGDYAVTARRGDRTIPITGAVRNDRGFCLQSQSEG